MSESEKLRADLLLVKKGLASSRTHAQSLIESSQVFYQEHGQSKLLKKPSLTLSIETVFEVQQGEANRFVSRGGLKLEGALKHCHVSAAGLDILDIGISTGGFTDCALQAGANSVLGVDVGHGQVHPSLLKSARLKIFEGVNARALRAQLADLRPEAKNDFDLIVMDVSFISMTLIIPELSDLLRPTGCFIGLVKPQFEVGADGLGKGGIVKDESLYESVKEKIIQSCEQNSLKVLDYFSSPIVGKDGNHEFFVYCCQAS